ncbi:MAG: NYN domain-containing protein [Salinisphaera sp.]|nr:NYN domain-containing protein [Salinisphaera sp.]
MSTEPLIAVFVDFENLALGVRDVAGGDFKMQLVQKRLLEKGRIVFKRAYCDWTRYRKSMASFHAMGIEMIDIPQSRISGKNSADIRMVVDAIDMCYAKGHIDMFALVSGDSDFSPLVSKLKENDKRVIGCGVKSSTSELLVANCDEFIYYDDLVKTASKAGAGKAKAGSKAPDKRAEAREKLVETVESLASDYDPVWGSLVKQTIKRVYPGFTEAHHGFRNFTDLLQDAEKEGLLKLDYDNERGNYKVSTA